MSRVYDTRRAASGKDALDEVTDLVAVSRRTPVCHSNAQLELILHADILEVFCGVNRKRSFRTVLSVRLRQAGQGTTPRSGPAADPL